jgi:hypothetical protein
MPRPKREKIAGLRMKEILAELVDVIYLMCDADADDASAILRQFTDMTPQEYEWLNIMYAKERKKN